MGHVRLAGSTAIALLLSQSMALAVTPEEVWTNWQQAISSAGIVVEGTAARNGDTLETGGVKAVFSDPAGGGTVTVTFDGLAFVDRGDGTVEVRLPRSYAVTSTATDGPGSFVATLTEQGLSMIASGTAAATSYDITAEEYALLFDQFTELDGAAPVDLTAKIVVTGLKAAYSVAPGQGTTGIESTATAASTSMELAARDPSNGMTADFTATLGPIESVTKGTFVGAELMEDVSAALKAGFNVDSTTSIGAVTVKGGFRDNVANGEIDASLTGANARIALDAARVDYGWGLTGADVRLTGSDLPVPEITTAFGEFSFNIMLPIAMTEAPQEWSTTFRLVDLTAADMLWSMFDPGGMLKRDPVSLIMDLKGSILWTADILDPAVQNQAEPPLELISLDVPQVLVKALGGQIDATGALTFDNSDLVTYEGFPAPTGKVTANLKGINALIDVAVSMGLISADEVMPMRMGLAMFAKPGAGPDELVSEVEFKDRGLFVNGQRLR